MLLQKRPIYSAIISIFCFFLTACAAPTDAPEAVWEWETIATTSEPTARHEASLVAYKDKLYLLGGRRINPVEVFDLATNHWEQKSDTPIELHHFQAVALGDAIYLIGAMTGQWPNETPVDRVIAYYPEQDRFEYLHEIPEARRRGGAGAVAHKGKIYLVGGITNGHMDGSQPWLDVYDPTTGDWQALPDAPHARDHFHAVVADNKLYAFSGRRSRHRTGDSFELTTRYGDVLDLESNKWLTVTEAHAIPTPRAGNMAIGWGNEIIIGGGESGAQVEAHSEVEAFDTISETWRAWPNLQRGRHGSGFAIIDSYLYTASGSGNRGGEPELTTLERLQLPEPAIGVAAAPAEARPVYQQWHTVTLSFDGPITSETATPNPFTDYRLLVEFTNGETAYTVRGYYAADGNAAQTGAEKGNVWQVRFSPDLTGEWRYRASLRQSEGIALETSPEAGVAVPISNTEGSFLVEPSDKDGRDFRAHGRLLADGQYFRFEPSGTYWLKGGANSPENLLGYVDFDGTYRVADNAREGEATAGGELHRYEPHLPDWRIGDPTWQDGKGKSLIGAINYLASEGMNSVYFLTMNILGDGKDVWPFRDHEDFTRFDASKLDQWEIVFSHMQAQGILLHVVTQETENELMFDDGNTGPQRQLYFNELIARFSHHPALVWNLGEENGPVSWRPEGQNTQQRKDMSAYLKAHDPYGHPVVLHTHSKPHEKDDILTPLLGFEDLDGLSFQVDERETVNQAIQKWIALADNAQSPWLITMDEIGKWHTGAKPDSLDPTHDSLRRHALWGTLLGGGAGVEWYFGAHQPGNDLTSEDWRMRANLWRQTRHALDFFDTHLPYWDMQPCTEATSNKDIYCMSKTGEVYALYVSDGQSAPDDLALPDGEYSLAWFDPMEGGALQQGELNKLDGGSHISVGQPPSTGHDWVILIRSN